MSLILWIGIAALAYYFLFYRKGKRLNFGALPKMRSKGPVWIGAVIGFVYSLIATFLAMFTPRPILWINIFIKPFVWVLTLWGILRLGEGVFVWIFPFVAFIIIGALIGYLISRRR